VFSANFCGEQTEFFHKIFSFDKGEWLNFSLACTLWLKPKSRKVTKEATLTQASEYNPAA
jgi:hypothetical protein